MARLMKGLQGLGHQARTEIDGMWWHTYSEGLWGYDAPKMERQFGALRG